MDAAAVDVQPGDIVLIRTGWARYWDDPARFISDVHSPGPALAGAEWLSRREPFAVGSDTAPFEFTPSPEMRVHVHLLVESGIHIIECLNLEELASAGAKEFLFVAAPLKIRGGTGSPIRSRHPDYVRSRCKASRIRSASTGRISSIFSARILSFSSSVPGSKSRIWTGAEISRCGMISC